MIRALPKFFPLRGEDCSPILRLLRHLPTFEPRIPLNRTRLILLDDDRMGPDHAEHSGSRAVFCQNLEQSLPGLGLTGLVVERCPIVLPAGPSDLNALYEQVWAALSPAVVGNADEVIFHISSGTAAMQITLFLAAHCLPLEKARLMETSREQDVREVRPPYVLATREVRGRDAAARPRLDAKARGTLLPNTVIDDPLVETCYGVLLKAARNQKMPQRLLLKGPVGSGKWHACHQFACWRGAPPVEWLEPDNQPELAEGATLLIWHLDRWPESDLRQLTSLAAARPDLAILGTYRTDLAPVAPLEVLAREGLRGAVHIQLPALGVRSDMVPLGEALARQLGLHDGKLKQRLQHDLLTDVYPRNLHDLKSVLATAATLSPGAHPARGAYVQAREIAEAERLLAEAWQCLQETGGYQLDKVLASVRAAVVRRAAQGRSQQAAGDLLGLRQQVVSTILKKRLDPGRWRLTTATSDRVAQP